MLVHLSGVIATMKTENKQKIAILLTSTYQVIEYGIFSNFNQSEVRKHFFSHH